MSVQRRITIAVERKTYMDTESNGPRQVILMERYYHSMVTAQLWSRPWVYGGGSPDVYITDNTPSDFKPRLGASVC